MLLSPPQAVDLCTNPAYAADLAAGRALEARHRLHIDGNAADVTAFLTRKKPGLLASPEAFDTMLQVQSAASATLLEGMTGILNKIFTATGGTTYFEFTDPALSEDFQAYLADTTRAGQATPDQFADLWKKQSLTGFQGVFLVDIRPADALVLPGIDGVPLGPPEPYFSYVPSGLIHDLKVTGDRIEYLILKGTDANKLTEYYCFDSQGCHRVQSIDGVLTYMEALYTQHGLGYVPACPVTTLKHDATRPVIRTSPLEKSLPRLDDYLLDYNWVRLGNAYHANPQKWSKGVKCDYLPPLTPLQVAGGWEANFCNAGNVTVWDGQCNTTTRCPRCQGQGRYIPVGPDKVYVVEQAQTKDDPDVLPVAGYIVPDLTSLTHLQESCEKGEAAIERAVLGKSGLLAQQTKAESGLKALTDLSPLTDRLNDRGNDSIVAEKFIVDTMARLRYTAENFTASQLSRGRRYHFYTAETLLEAFAAAKKGGADAGPLYILLEEAIYAQFADDPMELQRNLLKLELTPMPHLTGLEAASLGYVPANTLIQKTFINDFFARFEREYGSILEFGSLTTHQKKIAGIQAQFNVYISEIRGEDLPSVFPGRGTLESGAAGAAAVPAVGAGAGNAADATGSGAGAAASGNATAAG